MGNETPKKVLVTVKPSAPGYLRKYALAFTPIIAYYCLRSLLLIPPVQSFWTQLLRALNSFIGNLSSLSGLRIFGDLKVILGNVVGAASSFLPIIPALLAALVIAWVIRSREALASSLIALILPCLLAINQFKVKIATGNWAFDFSMALVSFLAGYAGMFEWCAWLGGLAVLAAVELSRRSVNYIITEASIVIRGGVWRRQEQVLPLSSVGRLVLEQSLVGKFLDYGTIVPVSSAEWGNEYYARGLGVEAGSRRVIGGVFYARALKEVSRDPLKCLYGIRHPRRIKELIEKILEAYARAPLEQTKYLREIRDMLYWDKLKL